MDCSFRSEGVLSRSEIIDSKKRSKSYFAISKEGSRLLIEPKYRLDFLCYRWLPAPRHNGEKWITHAFSVGVQRLISYTGFKVFSLLPLSYSTKNILWVLFSFLHEFGICSLNSRITLLQSTYSSLSIFALFSVDRGWLHTVSSSTNTNQHSSYVGNVALNNIFSGCKVQLTLRCVETTYNVFSRQHQSIRLPHQQRHAYWDLPQLWITVSPHQVCISPTKEYLPSLLSPTPMSTVATSATSRFRTPSMDFRFVCGMVNSGYHLLFGFLATPINTVATSATWPLLVSFARISLLQGEECQNYHHAQLVN